MKIYEKSTFQSQVVADYNQAAAIMHVRSIDIMNNLSTDDMTGNWMYESEDHILTVMVEDHAA